MAITVWSSTHFFALFNYICIKVVDQISLFY